MEARGKRAMAVDHQLDGGTDQAPQQPLHLLHERAQIQRLELGALLTRERQQLRGEVARAERDVAHRGQIFQPRFGTNVAEQLDRAEHGGQQVVEVVRQPTRQAAQALETTGVEQLVL
jgi:hypothetical protein